MDEIRSTLFTAKLRWLLAQALQRGERVLWQGQPDGVARMMFWRFLWWIGIPWLALAVACVHQRLDRCNRSVFLLMLGVAMAGAPLLMLLYDLQTLYVITNPPRADCAHTSGEATVTDTLFRDMDATFEILDIGRGPCPLNFASGISTRAADADHTGRYGFRCIRDAARGARYSRARA